MVLITEFTITLNIRVYIYILQVLGDLDADGIHLDKDEYHNIQTLPPGNGSSKHLVSIPQETCQFMQTGVSQAMVQVSTAIYYMCKIIQRV